MRERYYSFKKSNGQVEILTIKDAIQKNDPEIMARVNEIRMNTANVKRIRDGFQSGWQENIQAYCGDRAQYDRALKDRGLVELGSEKFPDSPEVRHSCANEGFIEALTESGVEVSGAEAEAIKSGELFKDETIN